ncbi:hypothetical protein ZIOFF_007489 [Zingiber officinale]|uniref:Large ribosomal subunit protein eL20 domain-containing protein n=1 Tax=Zingiber officinale TaxID=94328 RepID=A0A8J5IGH0_ZINOF|nr:hypothetical protein ZIOFF_007489 [Zingiber officinale]
MVKFRFHQYQVVGRALPTEADQHPKIYRMKLWATNDVRAKSKFWYFLRKLKKVKKSNGQVLAINEVYFLACFVFFCSKHMLGLLFCLFDSFLEAIVGFWSFNLSYFKFIAFGDDFGISGSGETEYTIFGTLLIMRFRTGLTIFERKPTKIKNYGIWLRYQSRTGYHNMYKEYRDITLNGAVEQMYDEMASRHRVRYHGIQIIKTATIPSKLCKRESTKQFHDSKIKFPLVFKKLRPPTRKLKTTFKASRPNLFT